MQRVFENHKSGLKAHDLLAQHERAGGFVDYLGEKLWKSEIQLFSLNSSLNQDLP
jgi:hypothetical protein